jgi:hypothetical protein
VPDEESVNHPKHYNSHPSGVEAIEICEWMTFNLGNAVKYLWRAGLKPDAGVIEDLKKAVWYIQREIGRIERMSIGDAKSPRERRTSKGRPFQACGSPGPVGVPCARPRGHDGDHEVNDGNSHTRWAEDLPEPYGGRP